MASVNEDLAIKIIANDGYYYDDPRVQQVITYDNAFGGKSWAILYKEDVAIDRYAPSEYVRNPTIVWQAS